MSSVTPSLIVLPYTPLFQPCCVSYNKNAMGRGPFVLGEHTEVFHHRVLGGYSLLEVLGNSVQKFIHSDIMGVRKVP